MFSEVLEKIDWDATTEAIYAKSDADVRRALAKNHLDVEDFMALISPAAEPYLETMAQLSYRYTRERFGNTMQIFIPLYITNSCPIPPVCATPRRRSSPHRWPARLSAPTG